LPSCRSDCGQALQMSRHALSEAAPHFEFPVEFGQSTLALGDIGCGVANGRAGPRRLRKLPAQIARRSLQSSRCGAQSAHAVVWRGRAGHAPLPGRRHRPSEGPRHPSAHSLCRAVVLRSGARSADCGDSSRPRRRPRPAEARRPMPKRLRLEIDPAWQILQNPASRLGASRCRHRPTWWLAQTLARPFTGFASGGVQPFASSILLPGLAQGRGSRLPPAPPTVLSRPFSARAQSQ